VFEKVCANCHALFGKGNAIGPDLTGANRGNLQYLLENVIDPSASVAADFRTSTVVLVDGRVVTGVVSKPTPRTVAVQTATEKLTLPASDVERIKPTNQSLMPEGLFNTLKEDQVRDLIAFLMLRAPGQR
jgi:putative heme-binding domain-containing protein